MTAILDKIAGFFASLSNDQLIAALLLVLAILAAKTIVEKSLTIAFTVIGFMAALYLIAPGLYVMLYDFLVRAFHAIVGAFKASAPA